MEDFSSTRQPLLRTEGSGRLPPSHPHSAQSLAAALGVASLGEREDDSLLRQELREKAYDLTVDMDDIHALAKRRFDFKKHDYLSCILLSASKLSRAVLRVQLESCSWSCYEASTIVAASAQLVDMMTKNYPINVVFVDMVCDQPVLEILNHLRAIEGDSNRNRASLTIILLASPRAYDGRGYSLGNYSSRGIEGPFGGERQPEIPDVREAYQAGFDLVVEAAIDRGTVDDLTGVLMSAAARWRKATKSKSSLAVSNHLQIRSILGDVTDRFFDPTQQEQVNKARQETVDYRDQQRKKKKENGEAVEESAIELDPIRQEMPDCIDTHPQMVVLSVRYQHSEVVIERLKEELTATKTALSEANEKIQADSQHVLELQTEVEQLGEQLKKAMHRGGARGEENRAELVRKRQVDQKKIRSLELALKEQQVQIDHLTHHNEGFKIKSDQDQTETEEVQRKLATLEANLKKTEEHRDAVHRRLKSVQKMTELPVFSQQLKERQMLKVQDRIINRHKSLFRLAETTIAQYQQAQLSSVDFDALNPPKNDHAEQHVKTTPATTKSIIQKPLFTTVAALGVTQKPKPPERLIGNTGRRETQSTAGSPTPPADIPGLGAFAFPTTSGGLDDESLIKQALLMSSDAMQASDQTYGNTDYLGINHLPGMKQDSVASLDDRGAEPRQLKSTTQPTMAASALKPSGSKGSIQKVRKTSMVSNPSSSLTGPPRVVGVPENAGSGMPPGGLKPLPTERQPSPESSRKPDDSVGGAGSELVDASQLLPQDQTTKGSIKPLASGTQVNSPKQDENGSPRAKKGSKQSVMSSRRGVPSSVPQQDIVDPAPDGTKVNLFQGNPSMFLKWCEQEISTCVRPPAPSSLPQPTAGPTQEVQPSGVLPVTTKVLQQHAMEASRPYVSGAEDEAPVRKVFGSAIFANPPRAHADLSAFMLDRVQEALARCVQPFSTERMETLKAQRGALRRDMELLQDAATDMDRNSERAVAAAEYARMLSDMKAIEAEVSRIELATSSQGDADRGKVRRELAVAEKRMAKFGPIMLGNGDLRGYAELLLEINGLKLQLSRWQSEARGFISTEISDGAGIIPMEAPEDEGGILPLMPDHHPLQHVPAPNVTLTRFHRDLDPMIRCLHDLVFYLSSAESSRHRVEQFHEAQGKQFKIQLGKKLQALVAEMGDKPPSELQIVQSAILGPNHEATLKLAKILQDHFDVSDAALKAGTAAELENQQHRQEEHHTSLASRGLGASMKDGKRGTNPQAHSPPAAASIPTFSLEAHGLTHAGSNKVAVESLMNKMKRDLALDQQLLRRVVACVKLRTATQHRSQSASPSTVRGPSQPTTKQSKQSGVARNQGSPTTPPLPRVNSTSIGAGSGGPSTADVQASSQQQLTHPASAREHRSSSRSEPLRDQQRRNTATAKQSAAKMVPTTTNPPAMLSRPSSQSGRLSHRVTSPEGEQRPLLNNTVLRFGSACGKPTTLPAATYSTQAGAAQGTGQSRAPRLVFTSGAPASGGCVTPSPRTGGGPDKTLSLKSLRHSRIVSQVVTQHQAQEHFSRASPDEAVSEKTPSPLRLREEVDDTIVDIREDSTSAAAAAFKPKRDEVSGRTRIDKNNPLGLSKEGLRAYEVSTNPLLHIPTRFQVAKKEEVTEQ